MDHVNIQSRQTLKKEKQSLDVCLASLSRGRMLHNQYITASVCTSLWMWRWVRKTKHTRITFFACPRSPETAALRTNRLSNLGRGRSDTDRVTAPQNKSRSFGKHGVTGRRLTFGVCSGWGSEILSFRRNATLVTCLTRSGICNLYSSPAVSVTDALQTFGRLLVWGKIFPLRSRKMFKVTASQLSCGGITKPSWSSELVTSVASLSRVQVKALSNDN